MSWKHISTAPHHKPVCVWTGTNQYIAQCVQNPITGDEAWLISEGPDGTQHLCQPTHWCGAPRTPDELAATE